LKKFLDVTRLNNEARGLQLLLAQPVESFVRNSSTRAVNGSAINNENESGNGKTNPKDEFIIHFFSPPVNI
jgi:hypothetical protein